MNETGYFGMKVIAKIVSLSPALSYTEVSIYTDKENNNQWTRIK